MGDSDVADELEALSAIYDQNLVLGEGELRDVIDAAGEVAVVVTYKEPLYSARFTLPVDYPSVGVPAFSLHLQTRHDAVTQRVEAAVQELCLEERGGVMLFQAIELVRSMLTDLSGDAGIDAESSSPLCGAGGIPAAAIDEPFESSNKEYMPSIEICHGEPISERGSTFIGHFARVGCMQEVLEFRRTLLSDRKIAKATHNIFAYRFKDADSGVCFHDNDDDGETAAGARLAEILRLMGADGVAVVVTRWFGGTLLGPARFRLINNCARRLLETQAPDCLSAVTEESGPKKSNHASKNKQKNKC